MYAWGSQLRSIGVPLTSRQSQCHSSIHLLQAASLLRGTQFLSRDHLLFKMSESLHCTGRTFLLCNYCPSKVANTLITAGSAKAFSVKYSPFMSPLLNYRGRTRFSTSIASPKRRTLSSTAGSARRTTAWRRTTRRSCATRRRGSRSSTKPRAST